MVLGPPPPHVWWFVMYSKGLQASFPRPVGGVQGSPEGSLLNPSTGAHALRKEVHRYAVTVKYGPDHRVRSGKMNFKKKNQVS